MSIEVKIDDQRLQRFLKLKERAMPRLAKQLVEGAVTLHQKQMTVRLSNRGEVGLRSRTGALRRSLRRTPAVPGSLGMEATSRVGQGAPYARIHERGGVIRPKRGRFLTVPLKSAKTAAGATRAAAKLVNRGDDWQTHRRVPGASSRATFIYQGRHSPIIATKRAGGQVMPLYILRRSVTIPARLAFRKTWREQRSKRALLYRRTARKFIQGNGR